MGYGCKQKPITIDLMSSGDSSLIIPKVMNQRVLESSDNPISSISTRAGLGNFKAFKSDDERRRGVEEPIVIPAKDTYKSNSSLADMFKHKKSNIMNKLSKRETCKGKDKPKKQPKTKEELVAIRKQMMKKRNRSTSPSHVIYVCTHVNDTINVDISDLQEKKHLAKSKSKIKDPPMELLERLAGGKKQKVS
jgi:membrane-bound inhibitor of C-type lysozyme